MTTNPESLLLTVGWREWVALPELGIPAIKAKVDSGARTSALHAFKVETFQEAGSLKVRFGIHPLQRNKAIEIWSIADVIDQRIVTDSGGHAEERLVIRSTIRLQSEEWPIELTLTDRETMKFRMLLGRTAMKGRLLVDPARSYLTGRALSRTYRDKPPPHTESTQESSS